MSNETTSVVIKNYTLASSGGGSNIWITHEGTRYYSRVNYMIQDNAASRNQCIEQFHRRRRAW